MNTQLTVSDLRTFFTGLFSSSDFINLLNQGNFGILQEGRWKGAFQHVIFPTLPEGYLTLPYEFAAIMGVSIGTYPAPVFSNQHEFIISGPGHIDETKPATGIIDYINDGFCTRIDPPTAGSTIRIVLDLLIDVGKQFRFYGNSNGRQIFDVFGMGMNVVTTGLTTNVPGTVFDEVTGIECPVDASGIPTLVGGWTLYSVDPSGNATQLSYYYPNEARPSYARYKTGTWNITNETGNRNMIRVLCQRRFIPVYKETDWVIPGNVRAAKAVMQAVQCEDANNYDQSKSLWAAAADALNSQVHSARGAAQPEVSIPQAMAFMGDGWWGWGGFGGYYG